MCGKGQGYYDEDHNNKESSRHDGEAWAQLAFVENKHPLGHWESYYDGWAVWLGYKRQDKVESN